jgi:hypothetical protein
MELVSIFGSMKSFWLIEYAIQFGRLIFHIKMTYPSKHNNEEMGLASFY